MKTPKEPPKRQPVLRSILLMVSVFMIIQFIYLFLHEGGHSLYALFHRVPVMLYVHPFFFSGFSRPIIDTSVWMDILGSATATPIALLISLLVWKRRSVSTLPLAMLFPWAAIYDGINISGIMGATGGDFVNVVNKTGLPAVIFVVLGVLLLCIGLIGLLSLFPLAGLDPHDKKTLFILPAAMLLVSLLSLIVARLFVPASPIDRIYALGPDILLTAGMSIVLYPVVGLFLAGLYVSLFRWLYSRLPAWLHTQTVLPAWKDFRIPGILWAASLVSGLIIVI